MHDFDNMVGKISGLVTLIVMRVPRREHRSAAFIPVHGTCLQPGLDSLVVCEEAVLPGVRFPVERRPFGIQFTRKGHMIYRDNESRPERAIICTPGSLVILAGGRWSVDVQAPGAHESIYLSAAGPWVQRVSAELAKIGGYFCDPQPPAGIVTALRDGVQAGLQRQSGWDWRALAAWAHLAEYATAMCARGGGTVVAQLGHLIDRAPAEAWRLETAAVALGMSVAVLNHRFRAETGEGPASWIRRRRMDAARGLLAWGQRPSAVAQALGFATLAQFSRCFRATLGLNPSQIRPHDEGL